MQTNENGDVILNIGANVNKARKSIESFARDMRTAFNALKGQEISTPKLDKLSAQAEQTKTKIQELKNKLEEMSNTKVETAESKKLASEWKIAATKVEELRDKYADFITAYENGITHTLPDELTTAAQKLSEIETKIKDLVKSGKNVTTVAAQQPKEYAKANNELNQEQIKLAGIQSEMESIRNAGAQAADGIGKTFKRVTTSVANGFRKIRNSARSNSASASKSIGSLNDAIKKGAKTLLKYGLGIRSFFFLFRKLRSAVVEGYKEMAQSSEDVNDSISKVKSSLTKLRNSTAAAVQPLVNSLAPVVTMLADKLSSAMESLGQFFAALTGQEYVYKAVDVQEDYANSLEDTAENAEKAQKSLEKYLSPLDDINRYSENTDTDTDKSAATANKFVKGSVNNTFKQLADSIKEYFTDIFKPIKDAWNKYGASTMAEWHRVLVNIKGLFGDVATAFKNVWTNGSGQKVTENILRLWKSIGGIINGIIDTFRNAWNKDMLGESVIQSFIDRFNNLLTFIRTVADDFNRAFNDGSGERIWTNILTTVRNINDIIGGFWKKLTEAWKANDNGLRIWNTILDIVEDISEWFRDISDITLDWINDLDFAPVVKAVGLLAESFRELLKAVGNKLKDAYKNILLPLAKWTFEKGLPALINLVSGALKAFADIVNAIPIELIKNLAIAIGVLYAAFKTIKIIESAVKWFNNLSKAFTVFGHALLANPYVAAILAIAAAITAVVTAIQVANRTKWETSELKKATDEINAYSDELAEAADSMKQTIDSVNDHHITVQADVSQAYELKKRLQEIISNGIIDENELPEYRTIIDLLSDSVEGFKDDWDKIELKEIDGKIIINTNIDEVNKQLDDFFKNWQATQYKTSLSESISELYKSQFTNKKDINRAQDNVDRAFKQIFDKVSEHYAKYPRSIFGKAISEAGGVTEWINKVVKEGTDSYKYLFPMGENWDELFSSLSDAKYNLDDYNSSLAETEQAYLDAQRALNFVNGETNDYVGALYAVNSGLMSEQDALKFLEGTGINTYDQLITAANKQRAAEQSNNEARKQSSSEVADNASENMKQIETDTNKAYGSMQDGAYEWETATNNSFDEVAAGAENSSTTIFDSFAGAFSDIWKKAGELWEKIKEIFGGDSGIGKGIANFAIAGINAAIRAVNDGLRWICEFINNHILYPLRDIDIGGWRPLAGIPTITSPPQIGEIPALAQGAVLPAGKPFLAMLGDQNNGRNLEAPESLIRQIVREETQRSSNNSYNVNVQVGSKTLLSFVLNEADMLRNQSGMNPFMMGGY